MCSALRFCNDQAHDRTRAGLLECVNSFTECDAGGGDIINKKNLFSPHPFRVWRSKTSCDVCLARPVVFHIRLGYGVACAYERVGKVGQVERSGAGARDTFRLVVAARAVARGGKGDTRNYKVFRGNGTISNIGSEKRAEKGRHRFRVGKFKSVDGVAQGFIAIVACRSQKVWCLGMTRASRIGKAVAAYRAKERRVARHPLQAGSAKERLIGIYSARAPYAARGK